MYACMYVYVCTQVCMHVACMYVLCMCMYIYMYVRVYVCIFEHANQLPTYIKYGEIS